jgi:apolipoprotein D and lipocalin family protein
MTNSANNVSAIPSLDLNRYLGDWFEICRLPLKWEDETATDVTATYSLQANAIRVDNRCFDKNGNPTQSIGEAAPADNSNAKLKVTFLPEFLRWIPFTKGNYWVLKLTDDYSVSLVGTPNREHLWLLARTPQIHQSVQRAFLDEAVAQGFNLSKLIYPIQSGRKVESDSFA